MKKYAVIVAGGSGTRLGSKLPKQFLDLNGYPLLWWSLKAFHKEDTSTEIILVLPEKFIDEWKKIVRLLANEDNIPHKIISGGNSRTESVKRGLSLVDQPDDSIVAVHDAARPIITAEMISAGWEAALKDGAAIPVVPVTDSLRRVVSEGSMAVDRSEYVAVQTPQVFKSDILIKAYQDNPEEVFSDDASAVEKTGVKISLYPGSHENIKVTNPGDMEIASHFLKEMND